MRSAVNQPRRFDGWLARLRVEGVRRRRLWAMLDSDDAHAPVAPSAYHAAEPAAWMAARVTAGVETWAEMWVEMWVVPGSRQG